MLAVVLVATLASAMLWQQWRGIEVETAQRTRVQSVWILTGALDWARLILREDARQGGADHLAEPWAVPLAPARLSTFLAAEHGVAMADTPPDSGEDAFLAGHLEDLQARLNVTNLLQNGQLYEPATAAWARLFKRLNLPVSELTALQRNLQRAYDTAASSDVKPKAPLRPQVVSDLLWLGLSPATLQGLRPFVTLLPARTPVNLNTAPPEVLMACIPLLDLAQANHFVSVRALQPLSTLADASKLLGRPDIVLQEAEHAIASRFFGVTGQLRVGTATLQEHSILQRDGMMVKTIGRTREALTDTPPVASDTSDTSDTSGASDESDPLVTPTDSVDPVAPQPDNP